MIPHIIPRPKKGSGFTKLISYIAQKTPVQWDSPIEQASSVSGFEPLTDYLIRHEHSISYKNVDTLGYTFMEVNGIDILHNCFSLESAADEMIATANVNVNCKDPVVHYVLSWQGDETPSNAQVFDCVKFSLQSLGLHDHQFVASIHRDTDNLHVHIAVNRINPITYRANQLSYSKDTLHKACRHMEIQHGFKHDNGMYVVNAQGVVVRQKSVKSHLLSSDTANRLNLMEYKSGTLSLYRYLWNTHHGEQTVADYLRGRLKFANSWNDVHQLFSKAGLTVNQSQHAGGLLIDYGSYKDRISVSWRKIFPEHSNQYEHLVSRLGRFEPSSVKPVSEPEIGMGYNPHFSIRDFDVRAAQRNERAMARMDLKGRYKQYTMALPCYRSAREILSLQYKQVNQHLRLVKDHIRATERDPLVRRVLFNAAEFDKRKAIAYIRANEQLQKRKFNEQHPRLNYKDWVAQEALRGDKAALSQLRAWAYREKRNAAYQQKIQQRIGHENAIMGVSALQRDDVPVTHPKSFTTQLLWDGTVIYRNRNNSDIALVDRGNNVFIGKSVSDDTHSRIALTALVVEGSPSAVTVRGNDEFENSVSKLFSEQKNSDRGLESLIVTNNDAQNDIKSKVQTDQNLRDNKECAKLQNKGGDYNLM